MAGIPENIIVLWPGNHSAIPSGWSRETALDGKYGRGRASGNAGNGGSATHNHVAPAHSHGGSTHLHSVTSGGNTTNFHAWNFHPNWAGSHGVTTHTHTADSTNAAGGSSGNTTPTWDSPTTDPAYYEMIAIKSDGSPSGFPDDCVVYYNASSAPTDWTNHAASRSRFIKSPSSSTGNGGTSDGGSHTHSAAAHTHAAPSSTHDHAGGTYNGTHNQNDSTSTGCDCGSAGVVGNNSNHAHTWDVTAGTAGSAGSQTSAATGGTAFVPPYHTLLGIQNTSGADNWLEEAIVLWLGDAGSPPDDWTLCNGGNNDSGNATPSLDGKFILMAASGGGDVGGTGNATTHDHPDPGSHTHSQSHTHTMPQTGATTHGGPTGGTNSSSRANYATNHYHYQSGGNSNNISAPVIAAHNTAYSGQTQTVNASGNSEPPYRTVAYLSAPEEPSSGNTALFGTNF